ncbi:hypothetical protein [Bradyrhizobium sp. 195]|uniref:hypothetical protein n=1 Tax=Bradyrhizobium sp. 195 TaxID=2782662 RepID=UPI0020016D71|nr:hypothetical protein [Bradyrhizobium sp. 195]UPK25357.1 hypothetical protein IVB26_29105 [Bradyrhizobium sp. 195]
MLFGVIVGLTAASAAAADPRDSVDRSQRLDTDALRDDVGTQRLRGPSHPLMIAPPQQAVPNAKKGKKNKSSTSGDISR